MLGKPTTAQIESAYKKLKAVKYPARPISNANYTKKKLNSFTPSIQKKLQKNIDRYLNAYRQVRGDGNCFFRALAFSFIANQKTRRFDQTFIYLDRLKLDKCIEKSIPKEFKPFYNHQLLSAVFKKYWEKEYDFFYKQTRYNYKRALSRMLNENHYLDFLIILYFRSLCWLAFTKKQEQFKQFLKGTEQEQITTYGQQSQGVIINICSKYLSMNIHIYEVRKDQVITYDYKSKNYSIGNQIYLLFYDNHYDLFEQNPNPSEEYEDQKTEEDYYTEVNNNFIPGTCIQCNSNTEISQETGLCLDCFNKSMQNFNTFQKDKLITDFCGQCSKKKSNISMQLMICQDCLNQLQYSSNVRAQSQKDRFGGNIQKRCLKCREFKKVDNFDDHDVCNDCITKSMQKSSLKKQQGQKVQSSSISTGSSLEFSSLQNRLQSKISKQQKQQEEGTENVKSAKIFERTKPIQFECRECNKTIKVKSQEEKEKCRQKCQKCLNKQLVIKASGFKNEDEKYFTCKKCFNKFHKVHASSMNIQSQICQNCSSYSKSSMYKLICIQCKQMFQPHISTDIRCTPCSNKYRR